VVVVVVVVDAVVVVVVGKTFTTDQLSEFAVLEMNVPVAFKPVHENWFEPTAMYTAMQSYVLAQ
jgi:hypothetical protein